MGKELQTVEEPPRALNEKQKRFVNEYLVDLNATQAAIRAGYSVDTAGQIGYQLLQKTLIQEAINSQKIALAASIGVTQEFIVKSFMKVANRCMQAEPVLDREGNETGEYVFNAPGANKALEMLGKHLALFGDEGKTQVNIDQRKQFNIIIETHGSVSA